MKLVAQFCSNLETNHYEVSGVLQMIRHEIPNWHYPSVDNPGMHFLAFIKLKVMLEALSIVIDLTLFHCFADTSLSPFGEKKVEALQGVQSQSSTTISLYARKNFQNYFVVTHSTSNQPGSGRISLACISSIRDVFVRHVHMYTL